MKYYIPKYGETIKDARGLPKSLYVAIKNDPRWFAEKAAEHVHWQEDGWEASWPINFIVVDDLGFEHLVEVERDMEPVFTASIVEKES